MLEITFQVSGLPRYLRLFMDTVGRKISFPPPVKPQSIVRIDSALSQKPTKKKVLARNPKTIFFWITLNHFFYFVSQFRCHHFVSIYLENPLFGCLVICQPFIDMKVRWVILNNNLGLKFLGNGAGIIGRGTIHHHNFVRNVFH